MSGRSPYFRGIVFIKASVALIWAFVRTCRRQRLPQENSVSNSAPRSHHTKNPSFELALIFNDDRGTTFYFLPR